jgi:hypothetical protein
MTIEKLIDLVDRRLTYLRLLRDNAEQIGDLTRVEELNEEIQTSTNTANQLRSLPH